MLQGENDLSKLSCDLHLRSQQAPSFTNIMSKIKKKKHIKEPKLEVGEMSLAGKRTDPSSGEPRFDS